MYTVGTEGRVNKQFLVGELRSHKPRGMAKKKKKKNPTEITMSSKWIFRDVKKYVQGKDKWKYADDNKKFSWSLPKMNGEGKCSY